MASIFAIVRQTMDFTHICAKVRDPKRRNPTSYPIGYENNQLSYRVIFKLQVISVTSESMWHCVSSGTNVASFPPPLCRCTTRIGLKISDHRLQVGYLSSHQ